MPKVINKQLIVYNVFDDEYFPGKALVVNLPYINIFGKKRYKEVVLSTTFDQTLIEIGLIEPEEIKKYLRDLFFKQREFSKIKRMFYKKNKKNE